AVTAPVTADVAVAAIASAESQGRDGRGGASVSGVAPVPLVSLEISEASRSMVGGARLARPESGDSGVSSGLSSSIPRFLFGSSQLYQNRPALVEPRPGRTKL